MTFTEDQKQLIDFLTGGHAFSDQEAEEMVELAEIGRLAVESRRAWHDDRRTTSDWLSVDCLLDRATDTYLAKQQKGTP